MSQKTPVDERTHDDIHSPSRRNFMRLAGAGIGVAATGLSVNSLAADASPSSNDIPSIRLADAFKHRWQRLPLKAVLVVQE